MLLLQFLVAIFLIIVITLFIVLISVRQAMWRINRRINKIFSTEKQTYTETDFSINQYYKHKQKIQPHEGEYVEYEEIKP